jgi:benzoate/toluate 1,2-dioxygenase subunit beta
MTKQRTTTHAMTRDLSLEEASRILYGEALALDQQRWDDWLDLYTDDANFWVPTWIEEHRLANDPMRELSLIYCSGKSSLADRVMRIRSGLSVASKVLPRTVHSLSNLMWMEGELAHQLSSAFQLALFDLKGQSSHVFFGRYEHLLRQENGQWQIAAKKVILMNDLIPTMMDFYSV